MAIISFRQVSKRYPGGFEALRLVSFTVEPGDATVARPGVVN